MKNYFVVVVIVLLWVVQGIYGDPFLPADKRKHNYYVKKHFIFIFHKIDRIAENWNCPFSEISKISFGLCESVETIGTESFGNRNQFRYNKYALTLLLLA